MIYHDITSYFMFQSVLQQASSGMAREDDHLLSTIQEHYR